MAGPLILVDVSPRRAADGVAVPFRLAGGGGDEPYPEGYRGSIVQLPKFVAALDFDEKSFGTGGVATASVIEWAASRSDLADAVAHVWEDAEITVCIGDEGIIPPITLNGRVMQATARDGKLQIALADPAVGLKKPFLRDRFEGTGGLEGPIEWAGTIKSRVFGRVWNLAGSPIDPANNIYCYADPLRRLQSFTTVRDKGAATANLNVLDWQGSAAATLTALQDADAPDGGGIACPSIACIKWWTRPAGDLTADIMGENAGGYVETTARIVERVVASAGGPAFAAGTVTNAAAVRPAAIGLVANDESTTIAQIMDELLGNVSLLWVLTPLGDIDIREWAWGASTMRVKAHSVARSRSYRPLAARRTGYRRNQLPMARNSLAAIVLVRDLEVPPEQILNSEQKWSEVKDDGGRPENNATRNQSRGNYSSSATYLPGDMVVWTVASGGDGSGYTRIGTGETTGVAPSNASKWSLTVQRGQPGVAGNDGNDGAPGAPATSAYLTNESATVWAYADGNVSGYGPATGQFKIFAGATDISANFALSTVANPQGLTVAYAAQTYTISGGLDPNEDTATLTIRATGSGAYAGKTFDKVFTLAKTRGGYEIVTGLPSTNLFDGRQVWDQSDSRLKIYKAGIGWRPQIDVDSAINGAKLDSRTVTIEKLLVSPSNLVQNSDFGTGDLSGWRPFSNSQYIYIADSAIAPTDYVLRFSHPGGAPVFATIFAAEKAYSDAGAKDDGFRVVPGAQFNVKITARQSNWAGRLRVVAYFYKNDGAYTTNVGAIDTKSVSSDWNNAPLTGSFTVPADCVRAWLYIRVDEMASGYIDVTNLWCARMADADLIVDGSILARNMAAGSVTADKIQAGAVTAAKLNVTALSAISADLGTVTAGRIIFNEGGFMRVQGLGFGSSNQFLEWFGPSQSNLNNCTEANAVTYLKKNGSAYFGGSLSAGVLKNAVQTTSLAANASVSTGTFSSNGNSRSVVVSFSSQRGVAISGSCNGSGTPAATVRLRRNGSIIQTWNLTGSISCVPGFGTSEPGTWQETIAGSWTYTDNTGGTSPEYTVELVSRTLSTPPTSTTAGVSHAQTLGVVSTEQ